MSLLLGVVSEPSRRPWVGSFINLFHIREESRTRWDSQGFNVTFCWGELRWLWLRRSLICPSVRRQLIGELKWVWVYLPKQGAAPGPRRPLILLHKNGMLTGIHLWWFPSTSQHTTRTDNTIVVWGLQSNRNCTKFLVMFQMEIGAGSGLK